MQFKNILKNILTCSYGSLISGPSRDLNAWIGKLFAPDEEAEDILRAQWGSKLKRPSVKLTIFFTCSRRLLYPRLNFAPAQIRSYTGCARIKRLGKERVIRLFTSMKLFLKKFEVGTFFGGKLFTEQKLYFNKWNTLQQLGPYTLGHSVRFMIKSNKQQVTCIKMYSLYLPT